LTFQALWLLCGLGTAAFASVAVVYAPGPLRTLTWLAIVLGFAGGTFVHRTTGAIAIDATWVGGLSAAVAALELIRPGHYLVTGAAAGALAALWAGLMQSQGLPLPIGVPAAVGVLLISAVTTSAWPAFAPPVMREEAMLGLGALALAVSVAPAIGQGWQSALALNVSRGGASAPSLPIWMLSCAAASVVSGGLWSWWRRG
jgi:hypothetical protein